MTGGQVVVVTGASSGVGRATVRAFASEGGRIGLIARGQEGLEATRREVEARGGEALVLPGDVADAAFLKGAAEQVEETFGPIDVWVNNAMTSVFTPVWDAEPEEFERVMQVCYLGQVNGTLAVLPRMMARDRGVIVSVGSALAYRSIPYQAPYCAAKHAVKAFFEGLRTELIHEGTQVQVVQVHLPAMNTPQFRLCKSRLPRQLKPFPPIFQPELAAEAILHVARHPRREMYVGWATNRVIYGQKVAPRAADWFLARNGFDGQQTDEPADPERPHNLWEPVSGDHGAHGVFDEEAVGTSPQLWASERRGWLGLAAAGLLSLGAAVALARQTLA